MIKVNFAASRPVGAYALAIPVRGDDAVSDRLDTLEAGVRNQIARAAEA